MTPPEEKYENMDTELGRYYIETAENAADPTQSYDPDTTQLRVGRERDRPDPITVALERPRRGVPDLDRLVAKR